MVIEINSTIILQACNFLIAYLVMRTFLFRPVVTVIEQEAAQLHGLITSVESRKIVVTQKEHEKRDRWIAHQQEFITLAPVTFDQDLIVFKNLAPAYTPEQLSPEHVRSIVKQATTSLVHKVDHVR